MPLTRGKLQLLSEGAEVFFRNVALKPIRAIPEYAAEGIPASTARRAVRRLGRAGRVEVRRRPGRGGGGWK